MRGNIDPRTVCLIICSIISLVLSSGCLEGTFNVYGDDEAKGEEISKRIEGSGYLDEFEEVTLAEVELELGDYFTGCEIYLNWTDEPPVEKVRKYENLGDEFMVIVKDSAFISQIRIITNIEGRDGCIHIDSYNRDYSDPINRTVNKLIIIAELLIAGDHYAVSTQDEQTKVDDNGNEYTFSIVYTYMTFN